MISKDLEALNMVIQENDLIPEQQANPNKLNKDLSPSRQKKKNYAEIRANSAISVIEIQPHPSNSSRNNHHSKTGSLPTDPDLMQKQLKKKNKTTKPKVIEKTEFMSTLK